MVFISHLAILEWRWNNFFSSQLNEYNSRNATLVVRIFFHSFKCYKSKINSRILTAFYKLPNYNSNQLVRIYTFKLRKTFCRMQLLRKMMPSIFERCRHHDIHLCASRQSNHLSVLSWIDLTTTKTLRFSPSMDKLVHRLVHGSDKFTLHFIRHPFHAFSSI